MSKSIDPASLAIPELHGLLLATVAPRPIAFVSTVNRAGQVNLSPFSFFNVFSANPPILIFSPARRVRDNTTKHTLDNVLEVKEASISIVTYNMVQQVSLASTEYDATINEFTKSGFTEVANEKIRPPRVSESPVSFECMVKEIKPLGIEGGAGNLVICEVVQIHVNEAILGENGKVVQAKLNHVARLGADWYARIDQQNLFEVAKPLTKKGIGIDQLPSHIRSSKMLTGNQLAQLANIEALPDQDTLVNSISEAALKQYASLTDRELEILAQKEIDKGDILAAWTILMAKTISTKK